MAIMPIQDHSICPMVSHSTAEIAPPRRASPLMLRISRAWIGPVLTALTVVVIVVARPFIPIPSPGIVLLVAVAASAVLGGVVPGLVSAGITAAFVAVDASAVGQPFVYDQNAASRLIINVASALVMAVMVGGIRHRLDVERERVTTQRVAEQYRALSETAADGMITMAVDGTIQSVNPATGSMFGHDVRDLVGRPVEDLLADEARAAVAREREQYVATGVRTMSWRAAELTGRRKDGTEFPIEVSTGEYDDGGRHFTWIIRDASARKALEDQLLQAQKMEAVGQLAGGVAHDFNNMLTAIGGFAELIEADPDDAVGRRHAVEAIQSATERATGLTRQLLAFSRRQRLEPAILSLNDTVTSIEPLLRRLLHEHIELVVHQTPELSPVLADPSQLETVVMNLAINGRDAMPDGGRLTISTTNVELDEDYAQQHVSVAPGPYVMLSVTDTGMGMDEETKRRIFEPFYTTKEVGRGTGLGLPTAYGVVTQSGGHVEVESRPGRGTTFKVYLPRAEGEVVTRSPEAAHAAPVGVGTILVAEDEPVVRALILVTLERRGYRILTARDGRDAMDTLQHHADSVDLLITDVVMPRLGGLELVEHARRLRPGLPAILISGYSEELLLNEDIRGDVILLEKPFTTRRLTEAIDEVLDRREPAAGRT